MMSNSLIEISSVDALRESLSKNINQSKKAVLLFGADWHDACPVLKMVLNALAQSNNDSNNNVLFGNIDAENSSELSEKYEVTMVPTVILLLDNTIWERLEGEVLSDPSHVTLAVQRLIKARSSEDSRSTTSSTTKKESSSLSSTAAEKSHDPKQALNDRLERLIRGDTVMLFMKGNAENPRCGFSRQAIEILNEYDVPFGSFDILSDEDVRQGLKVYSDWPTYPQIYVKGELMGGLDIMKEMAEEGSLKEEWGIEGYTSSTTATEESLHSRLTKLINRSNIMLFMKGLPSGPQCGFSRTIVGMLDETGVPYDAFNILEDDEVRQGLKEFSDWPTYPQLYVKGELLGGLDIIIELKESNDLEEMLRA